MDKLDNSPTLLLNYLLFVKFIIYKIYLTDSRCLFIVEYTVIVVTMNGFNSNSITRVDLITIQLMLF